MAGFESSIANKRFANQQMKQIEIEDYSGYQEDMQQFQQQLPQQEFEFDTKSVKQARKSVDRLNDTAKKRIEMLLGMTRLQRAFTIENIDIVLQTLKSIEMREALSAVAKLSSSLETPYEIRRQVLARSLVSISGLSINEFLGSSNLDDKLTFIDQMDEAFSTRLYQEYSILSKEASDKYSIKSEDEAKEVIEDLKK